MNANLEFTRGAGQKHSLATHRWCCCTSIGNYQGPKPIQGVPILVRTRVCARFPSPPEARQAPPAGIILCLAHSPFIVAIVLATMLHTTRLAHGQQRLHMVLYTSYVCSCRP